MTGKKPGTRGKAKGPAKAPSSAVPDVYRDMLADALQSQADGPERPLKRRRTGRKNEPISIDAEDDDDLEFEDVLGQEATEHSGDEESDSPLKLQQTAYRDSDEDSASDFDWDNIDFDAQPQEEASGDLELTLTKRPTPQRKSTAARRRVVTKEEKALRLQIHKLHILCLIAYVDKRNDWCSDSDAQNSLKPLLSKKMLTFLNPREDLSQFGQADSLKRGLDDVAKMWRTKFRITARGMRRALWADDGQDLQNYRLPDDADSAFERSDFRAAAKGLKGSRDVGAQLYCTLLRSAGVEARLVCSLQALSFAAGGPPMPRSSAPAAKVAPPEMRDAEEEEEEAVDLQGEEFSFGSESRSGAMPFSARRRLGHPNAAGYNIPDMSAPSRPPPPKSRAKTIHESPYPVFWVEVLDKAHQKWFPVDPLVTETIGKPHAFEPPASDKENAMSYVIAFEDEGSARDVTRRYTKAYNAKTCKLRVESTHGGEKWWRKTMRHFSRGWKSDLEQIEDNELAALEAREPMPRNVQDFKDHPYYALERHLRRNEILVGNHSVGTVAAGTPGKKKLESIFRRRDVKIVRSADAWYRLGREIKLGEQPVKTVAPSRNVHDEEMGHEVEERPGMNLYTEEQTEIYCAPPVVNGQVPKNSFGNLDVFVPSMVPAGGVHIPDEETTHAAQLLSIPHAPALTGFTFRGRHGTAVLRGAVVASEYADAVRAVIEGLRDERERVEGERRRLVVLRMWRRWLRALRIWSVVGGYGEGEGREGGEGKGGGDGEGEGVGDEGSGMDTEEYELDDYDDDDMGGGFIPE